MLDTVLSMNLPVLAEMGMFEIAIVVVFSLIVLFLLIVFVNFGSLWLRAFSSGCKVSIGTFIGMWLRKVNAKVIVDALIVANKAGVKVHKGAVKDQLDKLEAHFLAQGNVFHVVRALVAAQKADIALDFERAAAIDLAGRDVLDAVRTSVHPKVIDCPNPEFGRATVGAVAKDGIQLHARARVTVRTNLDQLVGGATEETIVARVGEGVVTAIGSAVTHKAVLENPDNLSKRVLERGLDSGTAYEILSIDIADIDVGDNIGAKLQADQAEADKRIAQAKAEERRSMAVARGHEMEALGKENQAKVILAEAEVPKAIAEAFRSGNMGVMDYYNMRNIQADTSMRKNIGTDTSDSGDISNG